MKTFKIAVIALITVFTINQTRAQDIAAPINKVTTDYIAVKNALFAGNGTSAQVAAKQLLASINAVPLKGMSADQQKVWATYTDKLQFDSRHISEVAKIDHQREHFESLSKNLFAVLKAFKVNTTTVYQQYCPMKKAYWISETATIKNPYFGSEMGDCGKTTETLKPITK